MKKATKIIALILSLCIVFSATSALSLATEKTPAEMEAQGQRITSFLDTLINDVLLGTIAKLIPRLSYVRDDAKPLGTDNFYAGDSEFKNTHSDSYIWKLGYGSASIIPDDFGVNFKYARGSYAPWGYSTGFYKDDEGKDETMKVRTILVDDCTGRGIMLIASVDCIGISNNDVRKIREGLKDFAQANNVKSLNISAIHSHQAIDSQGVWGHPLTTVANNFLSITGLVKPKSGVEKDYLDKIISATKESAQTALADMKEGTLTYTDIDIDGYMGTRTNSKDLDDNIHRLMFYPSNGGRGTVLASFGAHPEATSYGNEFVGDLSADYVYYMEKLVNKAGKNFIYVQGNVGTNSISRGKPNDGLELETIHDQVIRYGYEMAYITLGASMTTDERIALNDQLGDVLGVKEYSDREGYTIWYDGLKTFPEKKLEAVLNVKHQQVKIEMDNSTSLVLLKLGLASNDISYNKSDRKYYTTTEIGYVEMGSAVKIILSPGELYSELVVGGYGMRYSDYKCLREQFGNDVFVFDLMNDAIGYVCPDETYAVVGYKYNPQSNELSDDTWCLAVSIGRKTASTLMAAYKDLVDSTK